MHVYAVVEGQTEQQVVKNVLAPHLWPMDVYLVPIIVPTSRGHRGGGSHWGKWEHFIGKLLNSQRGPDVGFTTLFDL